MYVRYNAHTKIPNDWIINDKFCYHTHTAALTWPFVKQKWAEVCMTRQTDIIIIIIMKKKKTRGFIGQGFYYPDQLTLYNVFFFPPFILHPFRHSNLPWNLHSLASQLVTFPLYSSPLYKSQFLVILNIYDGKNINKITPSFFFFFFYSWKTKSFNTIKFSLIYK